MTEAEWRLCADPVPMLEFLRGEVNERERRLFACVCCRRVWHLMIDQRNPNDGGVPRKAQYSPMLVFRFFP